MAYPGRPPRGTERVAVVSDVHGNVSALRAVLADIEACGIGRVVNLGDVVGKGPRGAESVKLCREACEATVRGNWDTFISAKDRQPWEHGQWVRDELGDDEIAWLSGLPNTYELVMSGRRIRLFHASQTSEFHRVHVRHTQEQFRGMFTNTQFTGEFTAGGASPASAPDVVGYGDIHSAYLEVDEGLTLFNAGAVGNHLDAPSAPYAILEGVPDLLEPAPFSVSFRRVPYDIEAEIAVALELGMPEADAYALELRDGIFRGSARTAD
ncbi:metallophosphoesterase family protein [Terrabacter sp. NPDC080008]|uniref:metallophosphoesterase family protein n=1 Tax=Terrabacter sp. NPDC080008 TaxID=3155176 RepID=UPI003450F809